jgi:predicted transcriptional regulator
MSLVVLIGGIAMPSLTIRYDDEIHHKLKVIAATRGISLNALLQQLLVQEVDRWEEKYGTVKLVPQENPP